MLNTVRAIVASLPDYPRIVLKDSRPCGTVDEEE